MQQMNDYNNEITLRELIEILLKGWKLIALITAICLLFSTVLSFFILDPTYEAKTVLMASDATEKLSKLQNSRKDIEAILDLQATYPSMNLQTYKNQIKNPQLLQQVVEELKLKEHGIQVDDLINMITLSTIPDTNLITISVTYTDPKLATDIANTLATKFTAFITDMSKRQATKSSLFLSGQLDTEKKKLDEATLELKELLSQPRGANELRQEFDSKLTMLTSFKTQLIEKEVALNKAKAGLTVSEQELKNTPQVIVTKKSVGQDPLLNQIITESNGTSAKDAAQITMESEEVNEGYVSLKTKVSEYKIEVSELTREIDSIRMQIETTQKELEGIQIDLAEKEYNQSLMQRKVDLAQNTYDAYLNKYEETRIAESTEVGDSIINIISTAVIPELPTGPRKMLNLAFGGVLGIAVGLFVVFFKEYWKKSEKSLGIGS